MRNWLLKYSAITLIMILFILALKIHASAQQEKPLIVVTFPGLVDDLKLISGDYFNVVSIVPSGADPHEYQLTQNDIALLKKASIVVSTLHTSFEWQIDTLIKDGTIKADYIAIPNITGITYEINPNNGLPNPHMPIYDPSNYLLFMNNVTQTLSKAFPQYNETFQHNFYSVKEKIEFLQKSFGNKYSGVAVASQPEAEYAIEWLGFNISRLLISEESSGILPSDINYIQSSLKNNNITAVAVLVAFSPPNQSLGFFSQYDQKLYDIYKNSNSNAMVIEVPSPVSPGSILEKLYFLASQLENSNKTTEPQSMYKSQTSEVILTALGVFILAATVIAIVMVKKGGIVRK